jgi:IclR family pca regulon transcriptional regulator
MEHTLEVKGVIQEPDVDDSGIGVLAKVVKVLDVVHAATEPVRLADICREANLPRGTAHRLVGELVRHRFLDRVDDRYRLGFQLFVLGSAVQQRMALRVIARPHLVRLAERFSRTTILAVPQGPIAACVERVERGDVQNVRFQVGRTLPVHSGGSPTALLAGISDEQISDYVRSGAFEHFSPPLRMDLSDLLAKAARVRENGYSISDGDIGDGVASIGAPVRDIDGNVIAACSCAGLRSILEQPLRGRIIRSVVETAAAISADLGYRPVPTVPTRNLEADLA